MNLSLLSSDKECVMPSGRVVNGSIQVPSSKSVTQRFLNLTLLSSEAVVIERPLISEDTRLYLAALGDLGFEVVQAPEEIRLQTGESSEAAEIECGNNGTMLRFLLAALAALPGRWILDGSERLRRRPIGPLVAALRTLGSEISYLGADGFAPVRVSGPTLRGGYVELDAGMSSQFASALLMAAARAKQEIVLRLKSLASSPYFDLTRHCLTSFGGTVDRIGPSVYRLEPSRLRGGRYRVEGDHSAAAYPAAASLLTGGQVRLLGIDECSRQADRGFFELLERMGARVEWSREGVWVRGGSPLVGVETDLRQMPDQVPTVAALAPFAKGDTVIRNVPHLRLKESDRLAAMANELRRLGAELDELPDGLRITGSWSGGAVPASEVRVETYDDHRIAMSLAICGLRRPGVIVGRPQVVNKSYPSFWRDLEAVLRS